MWLFWRTDDRPVSESLLRVSLLIAAVVGAQVFMLTAVCRKVYINFNASMPRITEVMSSGWFKLGFVLLIVAAVIKELVIASERFKSLCNIAFLAIVLLVQAELVAMVVLLFTPTIRLT